MRKVVTVLFADIAGSTMMGEELDPEAIRTLLSRHFAEARAILERHGGTVEKFIGDAVMAVFGVPIVHEDDALRAVRAATELRDAVHRINADPLAAASIGIRIGVNTGEVVAGAGTGETLVTGDAVNTAARLQQAADPGDILIGVTTQELVRDAVELDRVAAIHAKGKAEAVPAARVVRVTGDVGRRRIDGGPLVGRAGELAILANAYADTVADGRSRLVGVVAPAGVGKSRLARDFMASVADASTVLKGRCIPYGDGITYWPIREIVYELAAIGDHFTQAEVRERLRPLLGDDAESVEALAALVGLDASTQRQDELFWVTRRVLERASEDRPVVALVEDLHWAEETLLDLLEYVVATATGRILVIATARPDLFDRRPGWRGTGLLLDLSTLDGESARSLLAGLPGGAALSDDIRDRIVAAADGNALFLEEMVAMLRDGGTIRESAGTWILNGTPNTLAIPATIHALLAARIDQLEPAERSVLQHGSVIGRSFEAAAVAELASRDVGDRLAQRLMSLVRRELLRPERADITEGDAYRFRHILIRDAAYQALPKSDRARLHERFAHWLERAAGARIGEYEEIVAHHLEQAYRYGSELGDADVTDVRTRAAQWALRAGVRARARDDTDAAIALLRTAVELGRDVYEIEIAALRTLTYELGHTSEFDERERMISRALDLATAVGDERELSHAFVNRWLLHRTTAPADWVGEVKRESPKVISVLEAANDDEGLAAAWHTLYLASWPDIDSSSAASERALHHARRADDPRMLGWALAGQLSTLVADETPVAESIPKAESIAEEARRLGRLFRALTDIDLAVLEAMANRYDEAVPRVEDARSTLREFNYHQDRANSASRVWLIHELGGHLDRAEAPLREAIEYLDSVEDRDLGPYLTSILARCLARQHRFAEAEELVARARVDDADPMREVYCCAALSHVRSAEGDAEAAVAEARRAVDGMPPQWPVRRGVILLDLVDALRAAGQIPEANAALDEARLLAERKGIASLVALIDASRWGRPG